MNIMGLWREECKQPSAGLDFGVDAGYAVGSAIAGSTLPFGSSDEHGDVQAVPDPVDRLAEEQVADQAVSVRADDQEVDRVMPEMGDELSGRVWPMQ